MWFSYDTIFLLRVGGFLLVELNRTVTVTQNFCVAKFPYVVMQKSYFQNPKIFTVVYMSPSFGLLLQSQVIQLKLRKEIIVC